MDGGAWLNDSNDISFSNTTGVIGRAGAFIMGSSSKDPGAGPLLVGILVMGAVVSVAGTSGVGVSGGIVMAVAAAAVLTQAAELVPTWAYGISLMLIGLVAASVIADHLR